MTGKILTANRVSDGDVVFFGRDHQWSLKISEALYAQGESDLQLLEEQLALAESGTDVTDAYVFDAELVEGALRPKHIRERIRTLGPTVRADLGKQSSGVGGSFSAVLQTGK